MATYYITKSRKQAGAYEHLRIVGVWVDGVGYKDKASVYDALQKGDKFVVYSPPAPNVEVVPKLDNGVKYIQTNPDHFKQNNLLNLPDC